MQRGPGAGLHGHDLPSLAGLEATALLEGHSESLVASGGGNADGLLVHETGVPLGVLVGQVHGVGREGLGAVPLLQQVGGGVPGDGPSDVGGHFEGSAKNGIVDDLTLKHGVI